MGRPIKKKWFTAYWGSVAGNLQVTTTVGTETIIKQRGTGVYVVPSGTVKLIDNVPAIAADPANGIVGDAQLQWSDANQGYPTPRNVRRINQYRVTLFDDDNSGPSPDNAVWRDGDANIIGTFDPALAPEELDEPGGPTLNPPITATGTVNSAGPTDDKGVSSVDIVEAGDGYGHPPTVTFSASTGAGTATGTAVMDTITGQTVASVTIDDPGSYNDVDVITVTFGSAP